jgi:CheY-like chemotaxis protein
LKVLVVEDHGESRRTLISLLEKWGLEVSATATDFRSAIEFLQTQQFDVLLCDIGLPDGTGFAVMEQARQLQPRIFGVAVSGFASPIELQIGQHVGFDHYMRKPVDAEQLHAILNRVAA